MLKKIVVTILWNYYYCLVSIQNFSNSQCTRKGHIFSIAKSATYYQIFCNWDFHGISRFTQEICPNILTLKKSYQHLFNTCSTQHMFHVLFLSSLLYKFSQYAIGNMHWYFILIDIFNIISYISLQYFQQSFFENFNS